MPRGYTEPSVIARLAVEREYLSRLCGDRETGGDSKLLQVGYMTLDVNHLAKSANHPDMNPNSPNVGGQQHLATYLGALRWDLSCLVSENMPGAWVTTMTSRPGAEPLVKAVQVDVPTSVFLMLAVVQPDGTLYFAHLRLESGFALVYEHTADVPEPLRS